MEVVNSPHIRVNEAWLAQHEEQALLPDLPIVDAHHHLWDRHLDRYLVDKFSNDIRQSGHHVVSSVYVQCRSMLRNSGAEAEKPIGEVEFATGMAAMFASGHYGDTLGCEAIVAGANLLLGDEIQPILEKMQACSGGRLRGVRNPLAWHLDPEVASSPAKPPQGLATNPAFLQGVRCLANNDLSLDVWVYHTQLTEILAIAQLLPNLTIIIDHCGGPIGVSTYKGQEKQVFDTWKNDLAKLSQLPNVYIKFSGLGMKVMGDEFYKNATPPTSEMLATAWQQKFDTLIALFGVNRCMFASNFPVDKGMYSYNVFWNACKRLAKDLSADEQAQLFWRTAATCYRLPSLKNGFVNQGAYNAK